VVSVVTMCFVTAGGFVGRRADLTRLQGLVEGLRAGAGGVVLVEGEQGIGKSALLEAGLAGARQLPAWCTVLWAAADELGQRFPLRLMADCLAGTGAGAVGAGAVTLGGALASDPVGGAAEAILVAVDRLCGRGPVVLVAEDLQWADEASVLVWHRLSRAAGQMPLLLAGSARPAAGREDLGRLRRSVAARGAGAVLDLGPLPDDHVRELVGAVAGGRPGRGLAGLAARAGGNPLYARELADVLVREGRVTVTDGVALLSGDTALDRLPGSLADAIGVRLGWLPEDVVGVLRWAALLGQEFSVTDLAVVTGRAAGDLLAVIDAAQAAGVVAEAGPRLGFRHGLIRQALYEGMPAAVRLALHLQAARALAGAGAAPERVAVQLAAAGGPADEWVRDWLAGAAPVVIYRAPGVAAGLLGDALAGLPEADPRRDDLEMSLLIAEMLLARDDQVQRVGRKLLARTSDPVRAGGVAWVVAASLMRTDRAAEATELVRQTLARPGISPGDAARLSALQATYDLDIGRIDEGVRMADSALRLAQLAGDAPAVGYAQHALALVCHAARDTAGGLRHLDQGLAAVGDDPRGAHARLMLLTNKIGALADLDRPAEAQAEARQALVLAEQTGISSKLDTLRVYLANCYFEVGQWDDAITEAEQAAAGAEQRHAHLIRHWLLALIAGHRGDPDTAASHLSKITDEQTLRPQSRGALYLLWWARAVLAEQRGDQAAAIGALRRGLAADLAGQVSDHYLLLPMLARLALAGDEPGIAAAAAEAAAEEAAAEPLPRKVATAGHCRGLVAGDPVPVLAAAAYWDTAGQPLQRAAALEDAAALAAMAGDRAGARAALAGARELYGGLGARWDIRRAESRLRALGVGGGRSAYRVRPVTGWGALTPTEVKVGELVATGLSNPDIAGRLFLSRNTVQTHVSHILAKLGARSRAEIARAALEHA
jgi:DNA-binding CsgD family transcriptional regulator/tetratricopeptide (TPR) repeat protein